VSSIFGALSSTASALEAQRRGLEVAGQNIANANTVGYSRRTLILAERSALEPGEAGRGVEVVQVRAVRDLFLEARLRQEQQGLAHDQVITESLSVLEAQLGRPGEAVDAQLASFFGSFSALAEDPASLTLRDAALRESERLATSFNEMATRFDESRRDADVRLRSSVTEINRVVGDLARLGEQIGANAGVDTESLIDKRHVLLQELATLTDIAVTDTAGILTVSLTSGQTLVSGTHVVGLTVEDEPGTGWARVLSSGEDVTTSLTGGELGGARHVRDVLMPSYETMLDRLAYSVATAANGVHAGGADSYGNPGGDLFDVPVTEDGAAAALQVRAAVSADAGLIVAGGASANDVARAMAALRDEPLVGGTSTATDYWGQIVYRVGGDSASASRVQDGRQQVVTQLQRLREAASGVSLDEEAASLMRYQRAYEANARYFTVVNDVLEILMGLGR
jgi:flagellar hook-associated protein 1 FlgK